MKTHHEVVCARSWILLKWATNSADRQKELHKRLPRQAVVASLAVRDHQFLITDAAGRAALHEEALQQCLNMDAVIGGDIVLNERMIADTKRLVQQATLSLENLQLHSAQLAERKITNALRLGKLARRGVQ